MIDLTRTGRLIPIAIVGALVLWTGGTAAAQQTIAEAIAETTAEATAETVAETTAADTEARALELSRELGIRQQAIADTQSELGIYAPELMESYGDLARLYIELEDYENAINLFNDALQVARINTGLFSEAQLGIIEAMIDSNGRLKDWEEVDDLQELNYHIHSRLHGAADSRLLSAAASYGDWKLRTVRENLLQLSGWSLISRAQELSDFFDRTLANAELEPEYRAENVVPILFGKTHVDLTLARSIANTHYSSFEGTERRYINQTRCRNVRNASGQVVRQCRQVQVENPRYRQSQREAKRFALNRQTREITQSIDRLGLIRDTSNSLSSGERRQLGDRIAQLQTESEQLLRASRRVSLF